MFVILEPFEERKGKPELYANAIAGRPAQAVRRRSRRRRSCVFGAPPVDGLGSTGGFKLQVAGPTATAAPSRCRSASTSVIGRRATPARPGRAVHAASAPTSRSSSSTSTATRPRRMGVSLERRLRDAAGLPGIGLRQRLHRSRTATGRSTCRPTPQFRMRPEDIGRLEVRNADGQMVPLAALIQRARRQRPGDRQPLQHVPVGRDQRRHGAGRELRPGHRDHGRTCRASNLPAEHGLRMDRADASADPGRQGPADHAGLPPGAWSSCSWCSPRSTRAGRCRWRSS